MAGFGRWLLGGAPGAALCTLAVGFCGPLAGTAGARTGPGTTGLYSRGRGLGADDMLITPAGLWIASDNDAGTDTCGGVHGLTGICFLPYTS